MSKVQWHRHLQAVCSACALLHCCTGSRSTLPNAAAPGSFPWPHLHFDRHGSAIVQHGPVHLSQAGGCSGLSLKLGKHLLRRCAQLALQRAVHISKGAGRHLVLQRLQDAAAQGRGVKWWRHSKTGEGQMCEAGRAEHFLHTCAPKAVLAVA